MKFGVHMKAGKKFNNMVIVLRLSVNLQSFLMARDEVFEAKIVLAGATLS